jgi:MFS family permease
MLNRLSKIYHEFPTLFWVIVGTLFIDGIGATLLFPFFALYITQKFGVGMTQAGLLLGMSSLFGLFGSMVGGALTDKLGRRKLILFGLTFSGLSSLLFGLASDIKILYPLVIIVGLLSRVSGPAHDAMIADILPEAKRQEGYGIMRVAFNYAWIFGTALGGLIAARSFLALFITDAVLSVTVALILFRFLPETKPTSPAHPEMEHEESFLKTLAGYQFVVRDFAFMGFILAGVIALLVYQQQYSSFPVYLRNVHHIDSQSYGVMLSITGLEVVIFQFWISRTIRKYSPFLMLMFSAIFFMLGFGMINFVSSFGFFVVVVIIITIGEMIFFPTSSALAASFAPADMRGRYMAVANLAWAIPATVGPGLAGLILDGDHPQWLWYIGDVLCAVSALGFYSLHVRLRTQARFAPVQPEQNIVSTS